MGRDRGGAKRLGCHRLNSVAGAAAAVFAATHAFVFGIGAIQDFTTIEGAGIDGCFDIALKIEPSSQ